MEQNKNGVEKVEFQRKGIVSVFVLLLVFFVIFMIFAVYTLKNFEGSLGEVESLNLGDGKTEIAVVEVDGVIMESEKVIKKLHQAEKDKDTKVIFIRVNSPGGAVGPTQEIYEEIRRIIEEKKIRVFSSFGSIAASGGYYIGAATERIYSNAGALTGSIGVIMNFMNLSKLYDFAKVKPEIIKAGKYKDIGNTSRDMTSEERLKLKDMLRVTHDQFKNHIVAVRKDRLKAPIDEIAQGQIYSGEQALELGLVDENLGLWAAARKVHKELKLKSKFGLKFIKLKKKFSWNDLLNNIDESVTDIKGNISAKVPLYLLDI